MSVLTQPPVGTPINAGHPLAAGLVGYWLLNEGGGQVAFNSMQGKTKHGALSGGAVYGHTPKGQAGIFDGTNAQIKAVTNRGPDYPMTLRAWMSPTNFVKIANSILYFGAVAGYEQGILLLNGVPWALSQAAGGGNVQATGTTTTVFGRWYCIHGVFVSATLRKVYVNGRLEGTNTSSSVATTDSTVVSIGTRTTTGQEFAGAINNAAAWGRVLSDTEIANDFAQPYQLFERPRITVYAGAPVTVVTGSSSLALTVTSTTAGVRTAFGSSTLTETVTATTTSTRTAFGASSLTESVTMTTTGVRGAYGASTLPLTVTITTTTTPHVVYTAGTQGHIDHTAQGRIDGPDAGAIDRITRGTVG